MDFPRKSEVNKMAKKKKGLFYEYTAGFFGNTVQKPTRALTKSLQVAKRQKVTGTRVRKKMFPKLWAKCRFFK